MERPLLVLGGFTVVAIGAISLLNANKDFLDLQSPKGPDRKIRMPIELDIDNLTVEPTTTMRDIAEEEKNQAPPNSESISAASLDSVSFETLRKIRSSFRDATGIECPQESGLSYLRVNNTDLTVQVCVDSPNVNIAKEEIDGVSRSWLQVPLAPDPNFGRSMNWVASVATIRESDCERIADNIITYVQRRAEMAVGEGFDGNTLPVQIVYSANEPTNCDQESPYVA